MRTILEPNKNTRHITVNFRVFFLLGTEFPVELTSLMRLYFSLSSKGDWREKRLFYLDLLVRSDVSTVCQD